MEEWKDIKGYEGLYEVSDLGNVRSLVRYHKRKDVNGIVRDMKYGGKVITNYINKRGYCLSNLCKNNKATTKRTHILVAEAFIPNPDNKPQVNHINGIKQDNRKVNLEWNTPQENIRHSIKKGLRPKKYKTCGRLSDFQNDFLMELIDTGELTYGQIAEKIGCSYSTVFRQAKAQFEYDSY